MNIQNNYPRNVFFKIFKTADSVYLVGLQEGIIPHGKPGLFPNWREPTFKLELKVDSGVGAFLVHPGIVFDSTASYTIDSSGNFTLDQLKVDSARTEIDQLLEYKLFDLRGSDEASPFDESVAVASSLTSTFESSAVHSSDNELSVGVEVGSSTTQAPGVGDSTKLSAEFTTKAREELQSKFGKQIENSLKVEEHVSVPLTPRKINVIEIAWSLTYAIGDVRYQQMASSYRVLTSASYGGYKKSLYDSPDAIPAAVRAKLPKFAT